MAIANSVSNVLLQPTKKIIICSNITAFETNEGLYIVIEDENIKKLPESDTNQDLVNKLLLANIDFEEVTNIQWLKLVDVQICAGLATTLSIASRLDDEFFEITNNKGKVAIIYIRHGVLYIPECVEIREVHVLENVQECFREIQVRFKHREVEKVGFMDSLNIIRDVATEISCKENSDIIFSGKNWIQRRGKQVYFREKSEFNWASINTFKSDIRKLNTHHPKPILSCSSELALYYTLQKKSFNELPYYVEPIPDDLGQGTIDKNLETWWKKIVSPFNFVWKYFYISIAIVIGILFGLGLMTGLIKTSCCGILVKMRSRMKRKNDYRPLIEEMQELKELVTSSQSKARKTDERLRKIL